MLVRNDRSVTYRQDRIPEIHTMALLAVAVMWVGVVAWMMLEPSPDYEMVSVVVQPGDTLWGLATTHYPDRDPREVVYIIREANGGLDPGALRPGDVVLVPKKEVSANQSGTKRATAATVAE